MCFEKREAINIIAYLNFFHSRQTSQNCFLIYPALGSIFGEGNGTPLQYSCLENPMDGGAWWAAVHGVAKSRTPLNDFTFIFHFHALEEEMATHSSVLAWRIPGTGEPAELPSMGSHRVGHDWSDLAVSSSRDSHVKLEGTKYNIRARHRFPHSQSLASGQFAQASYS